MSYHHLLVDLKNQDFDTASNNADIPERWLMAFVYDLAATLADQYGIPSTMFFQKADIYKRKGKARDIEPTQNNFVDPCF